MALCTVTGILYLPNGQVAKSRTLFLRKSDKGIKATVDGVVLPDDVLTQTTSAGAVSFQAFSGVYSIHAEGPGGGYVGQAVVPDAATALITDVIGFANIPQIPPYWYELLAGQIAGVQDAADAATQAAADAEAAAATVAGMADDIASAVDTAAEALTAAERFHPLYASTPAGAVIPDGAEVVFAIVGTWSLWISVGGGPVSEDRVQDSAGGWWARIPYESSVNPPASNVSATDGTGQSVTTTDGSGNNVTLTE